jgi:hypothetical protein
LHRSGDEGGEESVAVLAYWLASDCICGGERTGVARWSDQ